MQPTNRVSIHKFLPELRQVEYLILSPDQIQIEIELERRNNAQLLQAYTPEQQRGDPHKAIATYCGDCGQHAERHVGARNDRHFEVSQLKSVGHGCCRYRLHHNAHTRLST